MLHMCVCVCVLKEAAARSLLTQTLEYRVCWTSLRTCTRSYYSSSSWWTFPPRTTRKNLNIDGLALLPPDLLSTPPPPSSWSLDLVYVKSYKIEQRQCSLFPLPFPLSSPPLFPHQGREGVDFFYQSPCLFFSGDLSPTNLRRRGFAAAGGGGFAVAEVVMEQCKGKGGSGVD